MFEAGCRKIQRDGIHSKLDDNELMLVAIAAGADFDLIEHDDGVELHLMRPVKLKCSGIRGNVVVSLSE
jgi:hypothetical protein